MTKVRDIGEKRLIHEFIRPLFNASNCLESIGDDCAMLPIKEDLIVLLSTDRVPADLIAFKRGLIDYYGLGRYLAWLNISDIAACGGQPTGLLLNFGLPGEMLYEDFQHLCEGVADAADAFECSVLGGDISDSREMSISATSIGLAKRSEVLTRRGAKVGDTIFVTRPLGLTPAAFAYYLRHDSSTSPLSTEEIKLLNQQFTNIPPLVDIGRQLAASRLCSCCMDNTDGVGQSLKELSEESNTGFVVYSDYIQLPEIVEKVGLLVGDDPKKMAFGPGADFSLVGTLDGHWSDEEVSQRFNGKLQAIGLVEEGRGVYLRNRQERKPFEIAGWNYFTSSVKP